MTSISDRMIDVLSRYPSGMFTDFDGVLSEIAPTPDSAFAYPGATQSLLHIADKVSAAGVITGRAVADVGRMVEINDLTVVGNHGLEWYERGRLHDHPAGTQAIESIRSVMEESERTMRTLLDTTGMIWENKRLSSTIHFRNVSDPATVERVLIPVASSLAEQNNLRLTAGKMIVEFRPREHVTKGTALTELVTKHGLQGVVFAGDDVTDVDGFVALRDLRQKGNATLAVGVVTIDSHPDVAAYADVTVGSVAEFVALLTDVAARLGEVS